MALRFLEGFEVEQGSTEFTPKYGTVDDGGGGGFVFPSTPKSGSGCTGGTSTANAELRTKALVSSVENSWFSGLRWISGNNVSAGDKNCGYRYYSGATEQLAFVLSINTILAGSAYPSAVWKVYRGATLLGTSPSFFLTQWIYWEFGAVIRTGTNGSFEIRKDGASFYSLSSINTANAGTDGADVAGYKFSASTSQSTTIDDWYICDGTGSTNNSFLSANGDPVIFGALPSGNGNRTDWFASSGSNHAALVDDAAGSVNDADYVYSATAGNDDLYDYADFTFASGLPVLGVQLNTRGAMLASGNKVLQPVFRDTGGSEDFGTSWTWSSTSITHEERVYDVNPVTSAAWTRSALNAGQWGVSVFS